MSDSKTESNDAGDLIKQKHARPKVVNGKGSDDVSGGVDLIPQWVEELNSTDNELVLKSIVKFRKLLCVERNPPIDTVLQAGIVPKLVDLLKTNTENADLLYEVIWCLTNICSGTSRQVQYVLDAGALPVLVKLLSHSSESVQEQAVWAIGNIARDSVKTRDLVLKTGAFKLVLKLCNTKNVTVLRNAVWTLSNLCRGNGQSPFPQVKQALPMLEKLVYSTDDEVLTDACWSLLHISENSGDENVTALIRTGIVRRLVELLLCRCLNVVTPALRTIGNIVTGDDTCTQVVINCGVLPVLAKLLTHSKKSMRKQACWIISNITAGSVEQIQAVISTGIFETLAKMMQSKNVEVRREAAWAISNATSGGSSEQIEYLVKHGCIAALGNIDLYDDEKTVEVCLEALENILKCGERERKLKGGTSNEFVQEMKDQEIVDKLAELQHHHNSVIYEKSVSILKTYFVSSEENHFVKGLTTTLGDVVQGEVGSPTSEENVSSAQGSHVVEDAVHQPGEADFAPGENE